MSPRNADAYPERLAMIHLPLVDPDTAIGQAGGVLATVGSRRARPQRWSEHDQDDDAEPHPAQRLRRAAGSTRDGGTPAGTVPPAMPDPLACAGSRAAVGIRNVTDWIGIAGPVDDVERHEQGEVDWSPSACLGRPLSRLDPAPPAHAIRVAQSLRHIGDQSSKQRDLRPADADLNLTAVWLGPGGTVRSGFAGTLGAEVTER
jgi:hypothetical protein